MDAELARSIWHLLEPYHAVYYFAPETKERFAEAGLKGYWMGYFATRAAPMGPAPAEMVIATFYNFHPNVVRRAIPDAWIFSTTQRALDARYGIADAALRRIFGDDVSSAEIAEAAALAREAARAADPAGRPLFGANASLPWPDEPHLALWHAATLLREHRGDGHVATLVAEGIDGCECHLLMAAAGLVDTASQQRFRGWSEDEWGAARARLEARGLLSEGALTPDGVALRASIESRTDRLALGPYEALGEARAERLLELLARVAGPVDSAAVIPYPNPMGLPQRTA